jgi:hypothetical protein
MIEGEQVTVLFHVDDCSRSENDGYVTLSVRRQRTFC